MYHPQNQRIPERSTYLDSAAQGEQNECLHQQIPSTNFMFNFWFLWFLILPSEVNIEAAMYHPQSHRISEWCTYSELAAQNKQCEYLKLVVSFVLPHCTPQKPLGQQVSLFPSIKRA